MIFIENRVSVFPWKAAAPAVEAGRAPDHLITGAENRGVKFARVPNLLLVDTAQAGDGMTSQIGGDGVQAACRIVGKQVVKPRLGVGVPIPTKSPSDSEI